MIVLSDNNRITLDPAAEQLVQGAVEAHAITDVTVLLERMSDGAQLRVDVGSPPARYHSSSTSKPVAMAMFLHYYGGSLMDRVADVLPGYGANATEEQLKTEIRHLLSFTSCVTSGPTPSTQCWRDHSPDIATYLAAIDTLPLGSGNAPARPNGIPQYNMHALDTLGAILMTQMGLPWDLPDSTHGGPGGGEDSIWARFQRDTGLFCGGSDEPEWERSTVRIPCAPCDLESYTAEEYLAFLRAVDRGVLDDGTPFLPGRWPLLAADALAHWRDPYISGVYQAIHRDWHWTYGGFWVECDAPLFDDPWSLRRSTVGRGGQYGLIDRDAGYRAVVSPTGIGVVMGGQAGDPSPTMNGFMLIDACRSEIEAWAALGSQ